MNMKIYGIKCIRSVWNGCSLDEYLLDYFFSTYEKAKENLLKDEYSIEYSIGFSKKYEVVEIELDSVITKPEYRKNSL